MAQQCLVGGSLSQSQVLVVYGASGCGKTSLMALIAQRVRRTAVLVSILILAVIVEKRNIKIILHRMFHVFVQC